MRLILLLVLLVLSVNLFSQKNTGKLEISNLTGDFYIFTTFKSFGDEIYPANGMYFVTVDGVVMIDAPWDTTQVKPLLDSIKKRHNRKVIMCISTHSHDDRTGGINYLNRIGIKTYSSKTTYFLFKEPGEFTSTNYFASDTTFYFRNYSLKTYFPGQGHAVDNIVIWFEQEKILYGGCLVKSVEAKNLGNISHANMATYPQTIKNLLNRYPEAKFVIPGHQDWKNNQSLNHTLNLVNEYDDLLRIVKDFVLVAKYNEAINVLEKNISTVYNDTTGLFDALANLYFYKKSWQKIINLYEKHILVTNEDLTLLTMAKYYINFEKEKIEFIKPISSNVFSPSKSGTPIIEVIINGKKVNCWFDTGAGLTVLSSTTAKKCKLKMTSNSQSGATAATGKVISTELGLIDSMRCNGLSIKNHSCLVLNKRDLEFKVLGIRILKIDAIIGWNFIQEFDVKIENSIKSISFKRSESEKSRTDHNLIWMGQPMVNCTNSVGEKLLFFIDTGAQEPGVYDPYLAKIDLSKVNAKEVKMGSAGGMVQMTSYIIPEINLRIGNKSLSIKNVLSHPNGQTRPFACDGVLGINEFKNKDIHFNANQGFFTVK